MMATRTAYRITVRRAGRGCLRPSAPNSLPSRSQRPTWFASAALKYFKVDSEITSGAILLEESDSVLRMTESGAQMTISAWVYWDGESEGRNNYGIVGTLPDAQDSGWESYPTADGPGGLGGRITTDPVDPASERVSVVATWDTAINANTAIQIHVNGEPWTTTGVEPSSYRAAESDNEIGLGAYTHTFSDSGYSGYFGLNGYLDNFGMGTILGEGEICALTTAPALIKEYNADVINSLFIARNIKGSQAVGNMNWSSAGGFDVGQHDLGDTCQEGGKYYMWLDGVADSASGLKRCRSISAKALWRLLRNPIPGPSIAKHPDNKPSIVQSARPS